jgi:hypothetical protein
MEQDPGKDGEKKWKEIFNAGSEKMERVADR